MTTRTKQLAWLRIPVQNANYDVYTCPTGHRTIVKDVRVYNNDGSTTRTVTITVSNAGFTVYGHVFNQAVPVGTVAGGPVWCVMEPGQVLKVFTTGAANTTDVLISGAELTT